MRHLSAVLCLLIVIPVRADNADAIDRCAELEVPADRIACLEEALRGTGDVAERGVPVTEAPPAAERSLPVSTGTQADVPQVAPPTRAEPAPAQEESDTVRVTVSVMRRNLLGKLVFETEDGQVWTQVDQRVARYDEPPFEAEIRTARMGSFFLRPTAGSVSVRVRRDR